MQAQYYSDKSIAVFGDSKPWATDLKALGGKFNYNLAGHPGWIFPRSREVELMQFIANANGGAVRPTQAPTPYPVQQPILTPIGAGYPAMTPTAALTRLQVAQPTLPAIYPIVGTRPMAIFPTPMVVGPVSPAVPKPVTLLPAQPATIGYPNMFVAGDGLQYQIMIYTVLLPSVGQLVDLVIGETTLEYRVSSLEKTTHPVDSIAITQVLPEGSEQVAPTSRAIVMNGQWKVHCMQEDHTLIFH